MKITRKQLESLSNDDLVAIAREAEKLKEAAKYKTIESYWDTAHEHQMAFHKAASTHRIRYFVGGNRSGKSTAGFVEDILLATGRHPYHKKWRTPTKGVVIVQDFENAAKNILEVKLNEWCPKGEIEKLDRNQIGAIRKIYFRNGSTIDVLSHDQDIKVFEGSDYDFAHFDEPPPRKIYTAVWRGLTDRGGIMFVTATPLASPWMYHEYVKAMKGDTLRWFVFVKTADNAFNIGGGDKALGLKRIEEFASLLEDDEKSARLEGEFTQMRGLIFKSWDQKHHLIKPFPVPANWVIYESLDPHPQKPWAASWTVVTETGHKILLRSAYMEGDLEEIASTIIWHRSQLMIQNKGKPRITRCFIDNYASVPLWQKSNTDPTAERLSVRQELENYIGPSVGGPNVEVAPKNVSQKIELFKGWLRIDQNDDGTSESHFYVFNIPENEDFIFEIENYVWDSGRDKKLKDKPIKEDDDILDTIMQLALVVPKEDPEEDLTPIKIMEHRSWTVSSKIQSGFRR
jgi:phage terminase large subunit-like protein